MIFTASVALFAATVFLFLYGIQLQRRDALPKWAQREGFLHGGALGFTLVVPLALTLMMANAPSSVVAYDIAMSVATAVASVAAAYYLAAHLAELWARRRKLRP